MTSTFSGRVYFLSGTGQQVGGSAWWDPVQSPVELRYTDDRGASVHQVSLPSSVDYTNSILGSRSKNTNSIPGQPRNIKGTVGLSVVDSTWSRDVLRVGLPVHEIGIVYNPWSIYDRQSWRLVTFEVDKTDGSRVTTLGSEMIRASSGNAADSIIYAQIIESNTPGRALLTWLETDSTTANVRLYQRAAALGEMGTSASARADVNLGLVTVWGSDYLFPEAWSTSGMTPVPQTDESGNPVNDRSGVQKLAYWTGDYHYGSFLDSNDGTWRFVVGWPQPTPAMTGANRGAHVNLVQILNPEPIHWWN